MRESGFLIACNLFCLALGLGASFYVVRTLGPEQYGIIGILQAFMGVIANFLDFRITDLVSKIYYQQQPDRDQSDCRISIIQSTIAVQALFSIIMFTLGLLLIKTLGNQFSNHLPDIKTIAFIGAAESLALLINPLLFIQRFSKRYYELGIVQVVAAIVRTSVIVGILHKQPTVSGYSLALLSSASLTLLLGLFSTGYLFARYCQLPLYRSYLINLNPFWQNFRLLLNFNLLGYSKLLHRGADLLMVGYWFGDRETGLYKFARSLTDIFYTIFDALNKYYQPTFFSWLAEARFDEYEITAKRLLVTSMVGVMILLLLEYIAIEPLLVMVVGNKYTEAAPLILWLTVPVFFVIGIQLWIWPIQIFRGNLFHFVVINFLAILSLQYVMPALIFYYKISLNVAWCAIGYVLVYVVIYIPLIFYIRAWRRKITPTLVPVKS